MSCSGLPARRRLLHTIEASQRNLMGGSDADDWPKGSYCNKTAWLNEGCDCASQVCGRALLGAHLKFLGARFYNALANSAPNAVLGAASLPRRGLRPLRCCWGRSVAGLLSLPLEGCAGLARNSRSSRGARSKRRMIACISSAVGASTNAKPLDSCVSWLRITLTESATRFSAVSHALISSAVTHVGRLPRKTVKFIQ